MLYSLYYYSIFIVQLFFTMAYYINHSDFLNDEVHSTALVSLCQLYSDRPQTYQLQLSVQQSSYLYYPLHTINNHVLNVVNYYTGMHD